MQTHYENPRYEVSDEALVSQLRQRLAQERCITAEVLRLMAEVDRRKLYVEAACDSMFAFATRVLGMSEAAAYKRIQVARAGRRFPGRDPTGPGRSRRGVRPPRLPHRQRLEGSPPGEKVPCRAAHLLPWRPRQCRRRTAGQKRRHRRR